MNRDYYQEWLDDLERDRDELQRMDDREWEEIRDDRICDRVEMLHSVLADIRYVKSRLEDLKDE